MTSRKLMQLQYQINFECYEVARNAGLLTKTVAGPIYDGVPDEEAYLKSDPKILWILQEPHDNGCPEVEAKGNWSVPKDMILIEDYAWGNKTHEPIAKVMYAFRHNLEYDEVNERYRNDEGFAWKVMEILRSTAWINVSKMPCPTGTNANIARIRSAYESLWRRIVHRQVVEVYDPDIVIVAGAHWDYVSRDLLPDGKELPGYPYQVDAWVDSKGRQYLWTDHPTARKTHCFGVWVKALVDAKHRISSGR